MNRAIRVDREVELEFYKRRLPTERNHNGVIRRALEEQRLEMKLNAIGLTTEEMSRLWHLRALRSAL